MLDQNYHLGFCYQVLQEGEGELVVVRRPSTPTAAHHFLPCNSCFGFYHTKYLPSHDCIGDNGKKESHSAKDGRLLISHVLQSDRDQEDLDIVLGGLSDTKKYPGKNEFQKFSLFTNSTFR